ncbi:MAG: glycosyltransferase family 4 protein [Candidatus Omnitrophica bacterium]|nr:glycosyltransferase family 4 protein [Candidatus Omnitrophota bacterium]MBU0881343.1 glycosyltransferase family 4 protein [Candidatus Omnitrophota bacterium]MBU0895237.1 glycosyltransferase family 4 protein [Candidatus Omnitrophota bacterium]MBU1808939.1 glycosyltransferase family 4 protein [Candidatus Omnitrophota bacterium]
MPAKKDIRVLFLTKYSREGASTRYRFLQYFPYLEAAGVRCVFSPLTDASYLKNLYAIKRGTLNDYSRALCRRVKALLSVRKYDLVVVEYEILPYFPPVFEKVLKVLKIPYVVNYDDAIFYRYNQSQKPLVRALLGSKIDAVMRNAKLVIAGNRYLADYAANIAGAPHVEILPTVVDTARYPKRQCEDNDVFTIGWIGSPSTAKYLLYIAPALARVCEGGKARVILVGAGLVKLPGVPFEARPWSEDTEVKDLESCDAGIMPLDDGLWEKGKCGIKTIQYMACSLPVVVSPVGVNKEIVEDGVNGILASSHEEWIRALTALRDDKDLRRRLGSAGRKKVEERYSVQVTAPKFTALIIEAARSDPSQIKA